MDIDGLHDVRGGIAAICDHDISELERDGMDFDKDLIRLQRRERCGGLLELVPALLLL